MEFVAQSYYVLLFWEIVCQYVDASWESQVRRYEKRPRDEKKKEITSDEVMEDRLCGITLQTCVTVENRQKATLNGTGERHKKRQAKQSKARNAGERAHASGGRQSARVLLASQK